MKPKLSSTAQHLIGQPMFGFLAEVKARERAGEHIIHFEIGDPSFPSPDEVIAAAKQSLDAGETHYTDSMGLWELRVAITDFVNKKWGFKPSVEQIVVLPANAAIDFVVRCVTDVGEEVIVPDPGFSTYNAVTNYSGIKRVPVTLKETNGFRMNADDIDKKITKKTRLIISNSPQNPTGSVMSKSDVSDLYEVAKKRHVYLLSDEVYREIYYEQEPYSPTTFDRCLERTILLYSFSKTYAMSGWRLGFVVAPPELAQKIGLMVQTILSCVPVFTQRGALAALKLPDKFLEERRKDLKARRDLLVSGLNALPGITCQSPGGAFYAFPNIAGTDMNGVQFRHMMLEKAKVAVLDGTAFGKVGRDYVRLSYASTTPEMISAALTQMGAALKK